MCTVYILPEPTLEEPEDRSAPAAKATTLVTADEEASTTHTQTDTYIYICVHTHTHTDTHTETHGLTHARWQFCVHREVHLFV